MGQSDTGNRTDESSSAFGHPLPEFVDWIAAAVIALTGVALSVGGSALTFVVDRDLLADGIESGQITVIVFERDLTETEMFELTVEVLFWTRVGLLVTGIGLAVFAIGYVVARRRTHQQADDERTGSYRAYAVLGAVATSVLSFLPFSPILGGGIAGYLEYYGTGRSTSVGALAGFLAMVPVLVILVFVTNGLFTGLSAVEESGLGIVTAATMLLVLLFVAAYGAGLSALGGFGGGRLANSNS